MKNPHELLIALLDYIEQVEKLKKKATFVVTDEFFRAFQGELQGLPGIEFGLTTGGDDVWLRVPRLKEIEPPKVEEADAELAPWVVLPKTPDKSPELRPEIAWKGPHGSEERRKLEDFPRLRTAFDWYVQELWEPWASAERPRRRTIALYNRLFSLQQLMATQGAETAVELVWGTGMTLWKKDGAATAIRHPLLTQACEVSLDEKTFVLEVRPRDVEPVLELDCYAELEVAGVPQLEHFWRAQLVGAEQRLSPFEASTFEPVLKAAVGHLDPAGAFVSLAANPVLPNPTDKLCMTDTWVLFARKRSEHIFVQDVQRLKKNLEQNPNVPPVLAAFVREGDTEVRARPGVHFRGLSGSGGGEDVRELYFPMPYNDEQVSIVEKLETNDGVVVQGPPGTGKTHTIANVICHFLAQGKRVLVTSKGESALTVLQEKLPPEVRALSVALLSDERDGMKQFEHAVQVIASEVNALLPQRLEREIADFERRLEGLHQRIAALDHEIAAYAAKHLKPLQFGGREMLPEELAKVVLSQENEHAWLADALNSRDHGTLAFGAEDISALRAARLRLAGDLAYLPCTVPGADSFPNEDVLLAVHADLVRARKIDEEIEDGRVMPLVDRTPATFERARTLHQRLKEFESTVHGVRSAGHAWSARLRQTFLRERDSIRVATLCATIDEVSGQERRRQQLLDRPVSVPAEAELHAGFCEAVQRRAAGRTAFVLPLGNKAERALLREITVAGLLPSTIEDWVRVAATVEHLRTRHQVLAKWNAVAAECGLPVAEGSSPAAFQHVVGLSAHVLQVRDLAVRFDGAVTAEVEAVFGAAIAGQMPDNEDATLHVLKKSLDLHLDRHRLNHATAQVADLIGKLEGMSGAVVEHLREFLTGKVGDSSVADEEIAASWRELLAGLRRVASLRSDLLTVETVAAKIGESGATQWAERLRRVPVEGAFDPLTPATWLEAWNWRCAKTFLEAIDGHARLKELFDQRESGQSDLAKLYRDVVAKKAWLGVYNNSPENVRQALAGYLTEIQAIGAGTGVRAVAHRRAARAAMERAYRAVPCWVMPQWRVSETIPPEIGLFDLVVVDEASQSDIWALPALLRGKKLLVVGDHLQVSPAAVGMAEQKIQELSNRFLNEQPHGPQMRPDCSIYDLARVVFAGNSVMLREHFRCVPAIIEFSKREFYQHEIRPLRLPKRSERLDPPLIDVLVKGGHRTGDINKPEAQAIVDEIARILVDPAAAGRSIGVVTLLGHEQAAYIDRLIHQQISPADIVERRISAGAPPTFQGRERDIMLLSTVLEKGDHGMASSLQIQQRFNVAASRARDRMYLFRSIEESDVNPQGLNGRLMLHFRQPFRQDAQRVDRLRDLCESDFEREMFDVLVARGYRVRPQVKVGAYRIDLVVEGAEDRRLAVECDGDRFHGPGQWQDDMTRQRVLERAGWTFWRCFASSFVLRRSAVLDDLWATLAKMGIEPLGSDSLDNTPWVESRIIDPLAEADDEPLSEAA